MKVEQSQHMASVDFEVSHLKGQGHNDLQHEIINHSVTL